MAPHSSILAWRIPWTEKPGGYSPRDHKEPETTEQLHFHFKPSTEGSFSVSNFGKKIVLDYLFQMRLFSQSLWKMIFTSMTTTVRGMCFRLYL